MVTVSMLLEHIELLLLQMRSKDALIESLKMENREKIARLTNALREKYEWIKHQNDQIHNALEEIQRMLAKHDAQLVEKNVRLLENVDQLREKNLQLRRKDIELREKDGQIDNMRREMSEKDAQIDNMRTKVREQDAQIDSMRSKLRGKVAQLKEKDSQLELMRIKLSEKHAQIDRMRSELSEKSAASSLQIECITRKHSIEIERINQENFRRMERMVERYHARFRSLLALNSSIDKLGKKIIDSNREMTKKITDDFNEKSRIAFQAIAIQLGRSFESRGIARSHVTAYLSDMESRLMLLPSNANKHNMSSLVEKAVGGGVYELQHYSEQKTYMGNKTGSLTDDRFFLRPTSIGNPIDNGNNVQEGMEEMINSRGASSKRKAFDCVIVEHDGAPTSFPFKRRKKDVLYS